MMFENTRVLLEVPSSTSEKLLTGAGEPVKEKEVEPFGIASLMIVRDPGKITASTESERSWLPPEPSRSTRLVWYGEPGIATAAAFAPQSARVEICPPQASTGLATLAVNVMVMLAFLSPVNPAPFG